jgi:ABC-2 type transport system ATP-binding protein
MGETETIVCVKDLQKRYETLTTVDHVTFEIRRGEIFGLLGPNGAGKTTTISMLAGLLMPTAGQIEVNGHNARESSVAMRRTLGVVPQELAIYLKLTGKENLEFFGQLYGMEGSALARRVETMLALVGLTDRADSRADTYSGGMKRRLNLAVGLMHDPQLLLLDEPTVGVDPQSRNHIFEGVRQLNRQGLTILYTSHYMEEVEALCDRVGIMDGGKLIACDTVANLIARMGGAVIEVGVGGTGVPETLLAALRRLEHVRDVEIVRPEVTAETPAPSETEKSPRPEPEPDITSPSGESNMATIRLRTEQPNRVLPGLVAALSAADRPLHSLNIKQPNLEDVFLALTGKHLRD